MTALVSVAASFWGKAVVVSTPLFWGSGDSRVRGFGIITRESGTIDILVPIGFI
jgi:hypothetical protein